MVLYTKKASIWLLNQRSHYLTKNATSLTQPNAESQSGTLNNVPHNIPINNRFFSIEYRLQKESCSIYWSKQNNIYKLENYLLDYTPKNKKIWGYFVAKLIKNLDKGEQIMTYSIVGYCPKEKEWGIAVQSKFLGVGSVVPWAKAGVGAVATQSYANTSYGPNGLELMEQGRTAEEVVQLLTEADEDREFRQFGVIDAQGNAASFTGSKCYDWAGGKTGTHYAAQGNILVGEETVSQMAQVFEKTEGPLAERLLKALAAAQAAGGDSRGQQSASLLVVKEKGGYAGFNDRYIDLRVEDHPQPIQELTRIYQLQQLYFAPTKPENVVEIAGETASVLQQELERLGYYKGDVQEALTTYIHTENFEGREQSAGFIDREVLEYMKKQ